MWFTLTSHYLKQRMFRIYADSRERAIIDLLRDLTPPDVLCIESLYVGDFVIGQVVGDGIHDAQARAVIERKTITDLAASIKDGRLDDQMRRMIDTNTPIFIIAEGTFDLLDDKTAGIPNSTLMSILLRKSVSPGIHVLRSANTLETARWIVEIASEGSRYTSFWGRVWKPKSRPEVVTVGEGALVSSLKGTRKTMKDASPEEIFFASLTIIPGVSPVVARAIAREFGTIGSLAHEIQTNAHLTADRIAELNCNRKKRPRVGPSIAAKICSAYK